MKKNSILPATVYHGGVPMLFVQSLIESYKAMSNLLPLQAESSATPNLARTKNGYAFLKSQAEWIFLIDTDMVWEPQALISLTKTAKKTGGKIVSGTTLIERGGKVFPHHTDNTEPHGIIRIKDAVRTVVSVGGACLLAHRDVYRDMLEQYPGPLPWQADAVEDGKFYSEDITFCQRAKQLGYDIWLDPNATFGHLRKPSLLGITPPG